MAEQGLQDATFGVIDNLVMLDEEALPVYVGTSKKASSDAEHARMRFPGNLLWHIMSAVLVMFAPKLCLRGVCTLVMH